VICWRDPHYAAFKTACVWSVWGQWRQAKVCEANRIAGPPVAPAGARWLRDSLARQRGFVAPVNHQRGVPRSYAVVLSITRARVGRAAPD
jgi:hypothetical protein